MHNQRMTRDQLAIAQLERRLYLASIHAEDAGIPPAIAAYWILVGVVWTFLLLPLVLP